MGKIVADKRDYRKAYVRHKIASEKMDECSKYSKNLLLFYSIECGLKYLLMHKWDIRSTKEIEKDREKKELLGTHNLKLILKELNQQELVDFTPYLTNFQQDLRDVDKWIDEEMG